MQESSGIINNIVVLCSNDDKPYIEKVFNTYISDTIYTPLPELEFKFIYRQPWELTDIKNSPNIIISSLKFPIDSTGDLLMRKLKNKHGHNEKIFMVNDLYAKNQVVIGIDVHDSVELDNEIYMNGKWIKEQFVANVEESIKENVYKNGINQNVTNIINSIFGYSIELQPDYKVIKVDSLNSFVWIGRGYPYRWITIHRSKKSKYNLKSDSWNHLESEFDRYMPSIGISEYYRQNSVINKNQLIMRGLFEHEESQSGGPFFTYIFDTTNKNELILISGFVSYPGHDKILLLKQLEIIVKTFKKGELLK